MAALVPLANAAQVEAMLEVGAGPRLLFLYDPYCPSNWSAREAVEELDEEVFVVDVSEQPELGRLIQSRTGIRHESPKLLLCTDGRPLWHANHSRITSDAVTGALRENSAGLVDRPFG
ncbi:MAG: monothiol bacilliredoxin BrxC family protein [Tepidiformaceae bacterium]